MKQRNRARKLAASIIAVFATVSLLGMTAYAEEPLAENSSDIESPAEGVDSVQPEGALAATDEGDILGEPSDDAVENLEEDGTEDGLSGEEDVLEAAEESETLEPQAEPGFVVTGGTAGTDYTYEDGVLTFLTDGSYTVSMADGVSSTADRIVISHGDISALNLTLDNVHIETSETAAINVEGNNGSEWALNLNLVGDNTITANRTPITCMLSTMNTTVTGDSLTLTCTTAPTSGYNQWNNANFTLESGTVTINNGMVMAINGIYVNGGTLNINSTTEGLYAINEVVMTGGAVTIDTDYAVGVHVPSRRNFQSAGVQILGGTLEVTTRGSGSGAICAGTNGPSAVIIDTPETVKLHCNPDVTSIGILPRNGSPVTITDGTTTIDNCLIGVYFYANGDAAFTVGGDDTEVEIISSVRAINPYSSNMRDITFEESYIHKNYDGTDQASRAEVSDADITDENGRSKPYLLITPAYPITYDLGAGHLEEGATNPERYTRIDTFTLNNPVPDDPAAEFVGWVGTELGNPTIEVTVPEGSKGAREYTAVYEVPVDSYTITYDLNGGQYEGSTDNIVETYDDGTVIAVHAAPTREGYTFLYWEGSEYQPGDSYTVTEDHTFTAQWKKNDAPAPTPTPTPTPNPPAPTPGPSHGGNPTHMPTTGDEGGVLFPLILMVGAFVAFGASLLISRRGDC